MELVSSALYLLHGLCGAGFTIHALCLFQTVKAKQTGSDVHAVNNLGFSFLPEDNVILCLLQCTFSNVALFLLSIAHYVAAIMYLQVFVIYLFYFDNIMRTNFYSATVYISVSEEAEKQMCFISIILLVRYTKSSL
jgi:hypothetical protein